MFSPTRLAGTVAPPAMSTLPVDSTTLFGLLLVKVTVTPPDGAGVCKAIGSGADAPNVKVTGESVMLEGANTVTATIESATTGGALTWIAVDPAAMPVTGTTATLPFTGMVTLAGTAAMLGLSEVTVSVIAEGVGETSTNVALT